MATWGEPGYDPKKAEEQRIALQEKVDALARAAEPDALGKAEELIAAFEREFVAQSSGFQFQCERLGSFLILKSTRLANPIAREWPHAELPLRRFATTVNLRRVKAIELQRGHGADRCGTLEYAWNYKGHTHAEIVIRPLYPAVPYHRRHYFVQPKAKDCGVDGFVHHCGSSRVDASFKTADFPRTAEDDQILFRGISSTLFVPSTHGEVIHRLILENT